MQKYIFLDNWVFSYLIRDSFEKGLSVFLKTRGYTVLITTLSLVELYNSQWEAAGDKDRMLKAVQFLSGHPCVIVDPFKVWRAEVLSYPNQLSILPLEFDFQNVSKLQRAEDLLMFLRHDEVFTDPQNGIGKDIRVWVDSYDEKKSSWSDNIERIMANACSEGTLKRDQEGRFVDLEQNKELFLLSLDLRVCEQSEIDALFAKIQQSNVRGLPFFPARRLSSLCFWYDYVNIDEANRLPRRDSDIGDFYHISLIPYCAAFTTDGSMYRLLKRIQIQEKLNFSNCQIINPKGLREHIEG
jgi:hypothetical protein